MTDTIHVDASILRAVRTEAGEAGDTAQVADCTAALGGNADAMSRVAASLDDSEHSPYMIRDGEIVRDDDSRAEAEPDMPKKSPTESTRHDMLADWLAQRGRCIASGRLGNARAELWAINGRTAIALFYTHDGWDLLTAADSINTSETLDDARGRLGLS